MRSAVDEISILELAKESFVFGVWGCLAGGLVGAYIKTDPILAVSTGFVVSSGLSLWLRAGGSRQSLNWNSVAEVMKERKKHISSFDIAQPAPVQVPLQKVSQIYLTVPLDHQSHTSYPRTIEGYSDHDLEKIGFFVSKFGNYRISKDFLKDKAKLMTALEVKQFQLKLFQADFAKRNEKGREGHEGFSLSDLGKQFMDCVSKNYHPTPPELIEIRNITKNRGTV